MSTKPKSPPGEQPARKEQSAREGQRGLKKELVAASSEPLILSILSRGESYGYDIIQQIRAFSGGGIEWTDGMLYPVLHRLERQGLIESRWQVSEAGRKRKYYALSAQGKTALDERRREWELVSSTLSQLWGATACSI
jgi:DNA-binding PadR family transcriptional regulator